MVEKESGFSGFEDKGGFCLVYYYIPKNREGNPGTGGSKREMNPLVPCM